MIIISGGQTGVDRAGLDAAIELGLPHGGWCPKGRRALDGRIPPQYHLKETLSSDYRVRTLKNIMEADATLIVRGPVWSNGTRLTVKNCVSHKRQYFLVEEQYLTDQYTINSFVGWLKLHGVRTLNVAGPSEDKFPGIGEKAKTFIVTCLKKLSED